MGPSSYGTSRFFYRIGIFTLVVLTHTSVLHSELSDFCDALQEPLKIPKTSSIKLTLTDLPLLSEDKVHCSEVLHALTTQVIFTL